MESSKLNNWLGIAANLAVMVGIVFFIIELNQNTIAIENEASWSRAEIAIDIYLSAATNTELDGAISRVLNMTLEEYERAANEIGSDSASDVRRVNSFWGAIMIQNGTRFLTQPLERDEERNLLMRFYSSRAMQSYIETSLDTYDPEFSEYVKGIIVELQSN